jgi:phage I-like protein
MKLLLAALGLSAVASEEAGLTALTALQSQVTAKDALIVELRAKQFDPSQHIPLVEHKKVADQLAALSAQAEASQHATLMTAALADARILPANADYWKAQPLAALQAFLKDAKPLSAALGAMQTGGQPPAGGANTAVLSAEDKAVCEQLGIKPEDYLKQKAVAA